MLITMIIIENATVYALRPMSRASCASQEQFALSIPIGSVDRTVLTVMSCRIIKTKPGVVALLHT